ncbi:MAG: hypothetical protein OXN79_04170 [bacterium]|nr:hypothetical protein [Dehalococcoidia bacterium]MDE0215760.1 hypothetical protein [bacterium]
MRHYPDMLGGRLTEIFKAAGDVEIRRTGKWAWLVNHQYDARCRLELLGMIPSKRVEKLCRKRRIDRERLAELMQGATVPAP